MMTIGSLFSGIGGLELGLEWAGLGPVLWQVEIDPYCRAVLAKHWPDAVRYEDVRSASNLAPVDLICGGFPCQDVSSCGKREGLQGKRSGLWWEYVRVLQALRPSWCIVENVASGATRWLRPIRHHLHMLGYRTRALGISARDMGAPHLRRRIFVIGHTYMSSKPVVFVNDEASRLPEPATDSNMPRCLQQRGAISDDPELLAAQRADWWRVEPDVGRVANGVPSRVDRLRALGNAVVPQCAQVVGQVVKQMMEN